MAEKTITSMMTEERKFFPPEELSKRAWVKSLDQYRQMWERSVKDPEGSG